MNKLGTLVATVAVALLVGADAKDDAVKKEKAKLKGTWELVSMELGGKKLPSPPGAGVMTLTFDDDKMTIGGGEKKENKETTYTIDPSKKPATIDVVEFEGPNKGKSRTMIYSLEGDELKICGGKAGDERPSEFTTKEGSRNVLMTLKRQKK